MLHTRTNKAQKSKSNKSQLRPTTRKTVKTKAKRAFSTANPEEVQQPEVVQSKPTQPPPKPLKTAPYVVEKGRYAYSEDPDSELISDLDEAQEKMVSELTGELKKRVVRHKLKKPTLKERLLTTSDLYQDKSLQAVSQDDIGVLLEFDPEIQPQSMKYYIKPEIQDDNKGYWLVRPSTVQALNFIDENSNKVRLHRPTKPGTIYNESVQNLAVIYGHSGTSKSFTLAQAIDYTTQRGDIVIAVSGWDTIHDMDGVILPSIIPGSEGLFDQVLKSRRILENLAKTYPEQLKTLKLSKGLDHYNAYGDWARAEEDRFNAPDDNVPNLEMYPFPNPKDVPRHMKSEAGETLYDLAAMGAWRVDLAGRALVDLMSELRQQTEYPTFIAIDDVNALIQKSDYINPANLRVKLDATRLTFVRALMDAIDNPPQRGSTMIATSGKFTAYRTDSFIHRAGTKIRTTTYQLLEHQAMLEHYYTSKIILTPMDIEFFRRSQIVTASQPKSLREFASVQ